MIDEWGRRHGLGFVLRVTFLKDDLLLLSRELALIKRTSSHQLSAHRLGPSPSLGSSRFPRLDPTCSLHLLSFPLVHPSQLFCQLCRALLRSEAIPPSDTTLLYAPPACLASYRRARFLSSSIESIAKALRGIDHSATHPVFLIQVDGLDKAINI
jgi:hypothetical protein